MNCSELIFRNKLNYNDYFIFEGTNKTKLQNSNDSNKINLLEKTYDSASKALQQSEQNNLKRKNESLSIVRLKKPKEEDKIYNSTFLSPILGKSNQKSYELSFFNNDFNDNVNSFDISDSLVNLSDNLNNYDDTGTDTDIEENINDDRVFIRSKPLNEKN